MTKYNSYYRLKTRRQGRLEQHKEIIIIFFCTFILPLLFFLGKNYQNDLEQKQSAIKELATISDDINYYMTSVEYKVLYENLKQQCRDKYRYKEEALQSSVKENEIFITPLEEKECTSTYDREKAQEFYAKAVEGVSRHTYIFSNLKFNFPEQYDVKIGFISDQLDSFFDSHPQDSDPQEHSNRLKKECDEIFVNINSLLVRVSEDSQARIASLSLFLCIIVGIVILIIGWRDFYEVYRRFRAACVDKFLLRLR